MSTWMMQSMIRNELCLKSWERTLCDEQFAMMDCGKGKKVNRKGYRILKEAATPVVQLGF